MDKDLLKRRIDAIDLACTVTLTGDRDSRWIVDDARITLPVRRVQELVKLARIGLEHADNREEI